MKHGRPACFRAWVSFFPPLMAADIQQIAEEEKEHGRQMAAKGLSATQAEFPAFSFYGPALPPAPDTDDPGDQAKIEPTRAC